MTETLEEKASKLNEESLIGQKSQMAEVFENLDSDTEDNDTRMSSIDFNSRLSEGEINACLVLDELKRLGIQDTTLPRQKKRLSISLKGEGRKEKIQAIQGERTHKKTMSFTEKLGSLFKKQE